jgi:CDP-diacylglycerol--glycerol-3-phosphate 3-phosphatidyltransferase
MNVPNQLTVSRIGLTMVMAVLLTLPVVPFGKTLALAVLALASATDYWDGRLARATGRVSAFGQLMDPLADKILVCAAFVSFVAVRQIVPAWIVTTIIMREFVVTGLRLVAATRGQVLPAGRWGKHKMLWQTLAIVVIMLGLALQEDILPLVLAGPRHEPFLAQFQQGFSYLSFGISALVAVLTVLSGAVYLWESRALYLHDM